MKVKIKNKRIVAKETLEVTYDLLGEKAKFAAGQYFYITLPNGFKHHFTIVNPPTQNDILMNTTRLRDSEFKNTLKDLPVGSEVEVGEIEGDFTLPEDSSRSLVFIALGIGITPYMSMLNFIKDTGKDFDITLIYSDHDESEMAYLSELKDFDIKLVIIETGKDKRHVDANLLKNYLGDLDKFTFYISGPPKAVFAVADSLGEADVAKNQIKVEDFGGY